MNWLAALARLFTLTTRSLSRIMLTDTETNTRTVGLMIIGDVAEVATRARMSMRVEILAEEVAFITDSDRISSHRRRTRTISSDGRRR